MELPYAAGAFDFATEFMSLMEMPDCEIASADEAAAADSRLSRIPVWWLTSYMCAVVSEYLEVIERASRGKRPNTFLYCPRLIKNRE